jgi:hypothetical protein
MKNDKTVQQQILRDIISGKISYEVNIWIKKIIFVFLI